MLFNKFLFKIIKKLDIKFKIRQIHKNLNPNSKFYYLLYFIRTCLFYNTPSYLNIYKYEYINKRLLN